VLGCSLWRRSRLSCPDQLPCATLRRRRFRRAGWWAWALVVEEQAEAEAVVEAVQMVAVVASESGLMFQYQGTEGMEA
jgi:hypothetical protein